MAKITLNPCISEIHGAIGDIVFKRSKKGEAIVAQRSRKPRSKPSEAQSAQRQRFKDAVAYAGAAMADPDLRAIYEQMAAKERKGAFAAARDDYFHGKNLLEQ